MAPNHSNVTFGDHIETTRNSVSTPALRAGSIARAMDDQRVLGWDDKESLTGAEERLVLDRMARMQTQLLDPPEELTRAAPTLTEADEWFWECLEPAVRATMP